MTDLIYDFVTTGIDLILIGGILSALIVMLRGSAQLTQVISAQHATTQEFDYYLQYHMYDDTQGLSSSDALSAIVGYRYDLYCFIAIPDSSNVYTYYYNDPATGKYYKFKSDGAGLGTSLDTANPTGKTIPAMRGVYFTDDKEITYDDLVDDLEPEYTYKSNVCTTASGKFETEVFNRNTIVTGIFIIKNGSV